MGRKMQHSESQTSRATTFLVVDDDEFSAEFFREMLQQDGLCHIEIATNGKRALQALASMKQAPDMLVCDLCMPDMDGTEFMAQLGKQHYPGGIVLVSGANSELLANARLLAFEEGLNVIGAFTKPISRDLLLEMLARSVPKGSGGEQAWGCGHH